MDSLAPRLPQCFGGFAKDATTNDAAAAATRAFGHDNFNNTENDDELEKLPNLFPLPNLPGMPTGGEMTNSNAALSWVMTSSLLLMISPLCSSPTWQAALMFHCTFCCV